MGPHLSCCRPKGTDLPGTTPSDVTTWAIRGYVSPEIRRKTGQSETQNTMIKFYDFEGRIRCFIIGSKEKGVVD
ncbi:MAG: hypothetical protein ACM3VT_07655 [Solirubrobacterales bacterium]